MSQVPSWVALSSPANACREQLTWHRSCAYRREIQGHVDSERTWQLVLAALHVVNPNELHVDLPMVTKETAASAQLDYWKDIFERQRMEPHPVLAFAFRWLAQNQPLASRVCVVHGDFRLGNLLHLHDQVVAVLDWEMVHVGDPLEDVAWAYRSVWNMDRHFPFAEFVSRWSSDTGLAVDTDALLWHRLFSEVKHSVIALHSCPFLPGWSQPVHPPCRPGHESAAFHGNISGIAAVIEPTVSDLLRRTADALNESVAAELEPGLMRTQVKAAVSVMRRAAHTFAILAPTLDAEIHDITETLLSLKLDEVLRTRIQDVTRPSADFPTLGRLSAIHQALQDILVDVPDSPELRALFRRMVDREPRAEQPLLKTATDGPGADVSVRDRSVPYNAEHISTKRRCTRRSSVSSGWKQEASTSPWRTSAGDATSTPPPHRCRTVANTSTSASHGDHVRRPDEDGRQRRALPELQPGLERRHLPPEPVAPDDGVHRAERPLIGPAVEHLRGPAAPARRRSRAREARSSSRPATASNSPVEVKQHGQGGGLAAGQDQPGQPGQVGGPLDQPARRAHLGQRRHVLTHVALQVQHTDRGRRRGSRYHPRSARRSVTAESSIPRMASPSPRETLATWSASLKCAVASTTAEAIRDGSALLKMPEPTKTASAPSCITSAASDGVAIPPAQNRGTGRRPEAAISCTSPTGAPQLLGPPVELGAVGAGGDGAQRGENRAQVPHGLDDVPGARLALRADHGRPLRDTPERLAQVRRPADEGDREAPLVDVVLLVGRREDLGLVDEVDAQALEHLGLGEVPDAGLGHHRDGHGRLDALDQLGIAHPGHAAVTPDVGRHPFEGHDGHGAGVLGHLGLLGVDHVHDHAATQHVGQPPLHRERARQLPATFGTSALPMAPVYEGGPPLLTTRSVRRPSPTWHRDPPRAWARRDGRPTDRSTRTWWRRSGRGRTPSSPRGRAPSP